MRCHSADRHGVPWRNSSPPCPARTGCTASLSSSVRPVSSNAHCGGSATTPSADTSVDSMSFRIATSKVRGAVVRPGHEDQPPHRRNRRRPRFLSCRWRVFIWRKPFRGRTEQNMADLTGKVALVTGGSRGIGAAIALRLACEGAAVALTYATAADKAEAVAKQIDVGGGRALVIRADNSDPAAV